MDRIESLEALLKFTGIARSSVQQPDLAKLAAANKVVLHGDLRRLYGCTSGFSLPSRLQVLGADRSFDYARAIREYGIPDTWGYVPIADNFDSNPVCLSTAGPLEGYVLQVFHDASAKLLFHSLDEFFGAVLAAGRQANWQLDELEPAFAQNARTPRDIDMAEHLINQADSMGEVARLDAYTFAFLLMPPERIGDVAEFLKHEDPEVRMVAEERLEHVGTEVAIRAISDHKTELTSFAASCVEALKRSGIDATHGKGSQIRVDPGTIWLNTEVWYSRRHEPEAMVRLVEYCRKEIAFKLARKLQPGK